MQEWYIQHIIASTCRQLIVIVCPHDEIKRISASFILNNTPSNITHDHQRDRYNIQSSFGVPRERLARFTRHQDMPEEYDDEDGYVSLLQSKSESKLRCLTTKRKHNINVRVTKSEMLHLNKPLNYPNDVMKLDYIIKSFESIGIANESNTSRCRQSLKILSELDANEFKNAYVFIKDLKQFKESCLLHSVTCIK